MSSGTDGRDAYEFFLSPIAASAYEAIDNAQSISEINRAFDLLALFPEAGHAYDPLYEAAGLPADVLEFFTNRYGIYYTYQGEAHRVYVRFIEDLRRDPQHRFEEGNRP